MLKVTKFLADKVFDVEIDGVTQKYQIVPEFSSKLRADLYFWEHLNQNSVEGHISSCKTRLLIIIVQISFDNDSSLNVKIISKFKPDFKLE